MIDAGELRKGITIELDGDLYSILDYQHIKMGRGSAQVRLRLRNVRAGHTVERTFQAGDRFSRVYLEHRPVQYLYADGDLHYFMDTETYEQKTLSAEQMGTALSYLKEGMTLEVLTHQEEPISLELPNSVELLVVETDPGFKGDTATGGTKPARLETGLTVQVPLFVTTGETIRVDTRSGLYLERVA
ncbi:MAG: elongation factor P [Chloroflexi bacterium]|nr:elongation factor P [Chloroflexota bacterium]